MNTPERQILFLAPTPKDADLTRDVLGRAGVGCAACPDLDALCAELAAGAGAVLLPEEALEPDRLGGLTGWLAAQPPWSDLPVLVLSRRGADSPAVARAVGLLGNVTVLERPIRVAALVTAARTALRARERQYQTREHLAERGRAEAELRASEGRFRFLDELGEATRTEDDPAAVMAAAARRVGEHLGVTRCAYADVEPDGDRFTIRDDWRAPGAATTAGTYSLDLFGPRAAADMRAGRVLIVRDVDAELPPAGGADTFNAIGIKAIVCCPLVKAGRLRAMMAVHHAAPRDWSAEEVALVREAAERSWAHIERVRAAAELRDADRRKDEFLATLAHELRNPLAPVRNALHILRLSNGSGPAAERVAGMMERQVNQLVRLVDDLMEVSRITRGRIELRREPVELAAVVRSAVEASRPLIDAAGHRLTVALPPEPLTLDADPVRVDQILTNLLNNAAKYTDPGGRIALTARRDGPHVAVSVRDTGVGIPAAVLPKVFDLFAQAGGAAGRSQGGLGIGLSLVKSLAELHGGRVEARSDGPGRGSEFVVRLPLAAGPAPAGEPANGSAAALGRRRVLVVDDNRDAAESLGTLLGLLGAEARVVFSGPDALAAVESYRPHAVLLDIGMPGMDGHEVARRLRQRPEGRGVLIIALTGWGQDGDRELSRAAGFDHHLTKPADVDALGALLLPAGVGAAG